MIPYVMFGQSPLFGDYVDTIHALGGFLKKVVVNVEDRPSPGRKSFRKRLEEYREFSIRSGAPESVTEQPLSEFSPEDGERYVIGFRGIQVGPFREEIRTRFRLRIDSLIHPTAIVSPASNVGEGVAINPAAIIGSFASIGDYCMINRGATIGHDCEIGNFATIGPGADLASNVRVAQGAVIGIGAKVIEDLVIGENAYVAAGAVVIRNVGPGVLVAGVPAVFKRNRE